MKTLNPKILDVRYFNIPYPGYCPQRIVMDYEFDFYLKCDRKMYIDNNLYHITENTLVVRHPGQTVKSTGDYNCYILSLDFSGKKDNSEYTRNFETILQPRINSSYLDVIPPVFIPAHYNEIKSLFSRLTEEYSKARNTEATSDLTMQLLHLIITDAYNTKTHQSKKTSSVVSDTCSYIASNYGSKITVEVLANKAFINESYLIKKFKKEMGISPIEYLIEYRLNEAKLLLSKTNYPIKTISSMCGYNSATFFSTTFKEKFGYSPKEYRKIFSIDKTRRI